MSKILLLLAFAIQSVSGFSQKIYFVYLQTDNQQPFYVKMDKKVYSSSPAGYVILSKLRDTAYSFTIGFPQGKWPEQNFSVAINQKDHGYQVKNFGEKGWGLFDLQTLTIQMANSASAKSQSRQMQESKDVSVFTSILSRATDDPGLLEKTAGVVVNNKTTTASVEEPVKAEEKTLTVKQPVEIIVQETAKGEDPVVKEEPAQLITEAPYQKSIVTRKSESSTTEGFGLVFVDDLGNGTNDTIRLLIPNTRPVVTVMGEEIKESKRFLDILPDSLVASEFKSEAIKEPVAAKPARDSCTAVADESDFFKLRKAMAAEEGDDNMIGAANDYFKTKCFATLQIKNLSSLFLNDEAKLKFFQSAYPFVSDKGRFFLLENELKEEQYVTRFKTLLSN